MSYICKYKSPIGEIIMSSDGKALTGLWFENQKYFGSTLSGKNEEKSLSVFSKACKWLDIYFSGENPEFTPEITMRGSEFQKDVWNILLKIPYGRTSTYKSIAEKTAKRRGVETMSSQAVGGAVAHNPISIIIPCHRVVGTNGSLTGYAGGINKKIRLLELEGYDMKGLFIPQKGTAL